MLCVCTKRVCVCNTQLVCKAVRLAFSCQTSAITLPFIPIPCCRLLLEKGGSVEGNVDVEDDICTETPLQLASAAGRVDLVELLLSFGASPFLTTIKVYLYFT